MKILLATQNKGKVRELQELLADKDLEVLSLLDIPDWEEVEEDGDTFNENASKKAKIAAMRTGMISIADDSGLEVDALNGEPGVYSARYAGEPEDDERNNDKLLLMLDSIPEELRTARFRCALVVATPDGEEYLTEGVVEGRILKQRRGSNGFGYDSLFFVTEMGRTMADLTVVQKNKFSHRAQAFHKVIPILQRLKEKQLKA